MRLYMKKILCTICARGGSKGVKNKNLLMIAGKPLIAHTIDQALKSGLFKHVVISTDSDQIASVAKEYGAEVFFKRDQSMASDTAGKLQVIQDAFQKSEEYYDIEFDYLIDLDATSPLRDVSDIIDTYAHLIKNNYENVITASVSRRSPYFNMVEFDENKQLKTSKSVDSLVVRRQDAPQTYDMNASIYAWTRDGLLKRQSVIHENTGLFIMPEERSIDIDNPIDLEVVSYLLSKKVGIDNAK